MKVKSKRRWWLIPLVLLVLALLLVLPFTRAHGRTEWSIALDSADAGFYRITWEDPNTNQPDRKFVSNAYVFGILKIFSRTDTPISNTNVSHHILRRSF
jgi:hypothetical protein